MKGIFLNSDQWASDQPIVDEANPKMAFLGSIRKLAEQAIECKSVSGTPLWPLLQCQPLGSYHACVSVLTYFDDELLHETE